MCDSTIPFIPSVLPMLSEVTIDTVLPTTPLMIPRLPDLSELLAVNHFYAVHYRHLKPYLDGCIVNIENQIAMCKENVAAGDRSSAKELAQLTSFHHVLVNNVLKSLDDSSVKALMYQ